MSHTTTIRSIVIRDVRAIESAVRELQNQGVQIELNRNAKPGMYYNNQEGVCDYVLTLKGAVYGNKQYDVGLKRNAEGVYETVFDDWGRAVSSQIGATCPMPNTPEHRAQHSIGRFLQEYGKFAAINAATAQGYLVTGTIKDKDGNYQITVDVAA